MIGKRAGINLLLTLLLIGLACVVCKESLLLGGAFYITGTIQGLSTSFRAMTDRIRTW